MATCSASFSIRVAGTQSTDNCKLTINDPPAAEYTAGAGRQRVTAVFNYFRGRPARTTWGIVVTGSRSGAGTGTAPHLTISNPSPTGPEAGGSFSNLTNTVTQVVYIPAYSEQELTNLGAGEDAYTITFHLGTSTEIAALSPSTYT